MSRTLGLVVSAALALTCGVGATATAADRSGQTAVQSHPPAHHKPKVTLSLPASVVEGEPFTIQAKVSRVDDAKQVELLRSTGSSWELVAKSKFRKKRKTYTFSDVGGVADTVRYRIKVLLDKGAAVSDPADAAVWHWTPLTDFDDYEHSDGVNFGNNVHITMNGVEYRGGWETFGKYGTWDTRITPGRHCNALRGVAGISDDSAEGSSAVITVVADDLTTVYTSPTLIPGISVPFQVALPAPFRLAMLAQRTSQPLLTPYPAIAAPELLCTGLAA